MTKRGRLASGRSAIAPDTLPGGHIRRMDKDHEQPTPATVLIVDDEPSIREVLDELLQGRGLRTLEAANGIEALLQVKHQHPDVVLLDLTMPRVDGLETLKHIHRFDPRIRVIVLTASLNPDVHQAARRAGASDVVTKPCDLEQLVRMIVGR